MMTTSIARLCVLLLALTFAAGCSRSGQDQSTGAGGHAHTAPHGGTLIEVGQHAYNLEFVLDSSTGKLTMYILDGHAENFVRIAATAVELVAISDGERRPLTLRAVVNPATGETVGNTSQFEAQADWLKNTGEFPGTIGRLELQGTTFENIAVYVRK